MENNSSNYSYYYFIKNNHLLEKFIKTQKKLAIYINDMPELLIDNGQFEKLKLGIDEMRDKAYSVIGPLVEAKNASEKRIKQLETSCGELVYHFETEQKKVENLEQQLRHLANESAGQVTFCTHLGAVLGNLIWKSSRSSPQVDLWLNENRQNLKDLLSITNTALESFIQTFEGKFPDMKEEQYQFMMSLMGTVTNISSNSTGRQFLISHEQNGKELIKLIVLSIPGLPLISGDPLKRLMLMILYNVSLNCSGLSYLISLKVHELVTYCLDQSPEIQLNSLRIIQSITYDLKDSGIFDRLLQFLPVIKIQQLIISSDERISEAASGILSNMKKFYATADTISTMSSDN
ncbi:heat shock factor 2-binding protein isoform X2 [Diachasma alloeum]|uniref:heat shock factor 2-binding protein isoform X2 n=1 Tax=Diachasma alloeum TaxID=454923 RepID=UPI0007382B41|nr:heat shock factor 2-binding protein isoform X2 [Diachasma alloeum]